MDLAKLETAIKTFEQRKCVEKVLSAENESAVSRGENFTSVVVRSKLSVVLGSGKQCTKSVIVKNPPISAATKNHMGDIYKVEISVYNNVLSNMEHIINESTDVEEKPWCRMLGYTQDDQLILEDLKVKGYISADRVEMLDMKHTEFLLKSLAKFHVLGKILIERGTVNTDIYKTYFFTKGSFLEKQWVRSAKTFAKVVETKWGPKWGKLARKLKELDAEKARKNFDHLLNLDCKFKVICHGDCWTNNFVFRYIPNTNEPIEMKLLDFQVVHYNSYIWDLIYSIYNSVKADLRRTKLHEIFQIYSDSVRKYAELYSYKGFVPDLEDVKEKFKLFNFFAYYILITLHPIIMAETQETVNFDKLDDEDGFINPILYESALFRTNTEDEFAAFCERIETNGA